MAETTTTGIQRVLHITMIVEDQDRALRFYQEAFGAQVRDDQAFDFGGQPMRWLTMGIPGDDLSWAITPPMPSPGKDAPPSVGDGNMTVLEVADVDALCPAVEAAGGTLASPPEDMPWGRSAVVRDPDGNPWNLVRPTA